jgi:hypothetical protein
VLRRKSDKAKAPKAKKEKAKKSPKARPARKSKSREGIVVQKKPTDVYTAMLMISLAAMAIACLMMFLEYRKYSAT